MKVITIIIADSNELLDVFIVEGTTVGDILTTLELKGYFLRSLADPNRILSEQERLYNLLQDGDRLYAIPIALFT